MIFYKGLKQIVRTIPIYAGLAVVVIVGVILINLDVFGYNNYVPKSEDVKSAGLISSEYSTVGKNISKYYTKSAGDFTDEADIKSIINVHNEILTKKRRIQLLRLNFQVCGAVCFTIPSENMQATR